MKRLNVLLAAFAFAAIALAMWNCNEEKGAKSIELTEADKVVASAEFQAYSQVLKNHTETIVAAFGKLSADDKRKMADLKDAYANDPSIDFLAVAGAILGLDLKSGYAAVAEYGAKVEYPATISTQDMIKAMARYSKAATRTVSLTPSEICMENCTEVYDWDQLYCLHWYLQTKDDELYAACLYAALVDYNACNVECSKL